MSDFRPDALGATAPLAPPFYPSAVYSLPDLDTLERIATGEEPGFVYARDAHPNARRLASRLAELEGADWAVMCASGMAAISAAILGFIRAGGRIVAGDQLYGRTIQLLTQELGRFGVTAAFVDLCNLDQVRDALAAPADLLFVETLSNPMLRVPDLDELAKLSQRHGCRLAVDNTFATPILTRPLQRGADLVIESVTKLIGGHSDVTLGLLCGRGERGPEVTTQVSIWGLSASPFDCWLAERGLATLAMRARAASANAAALADWLARQPGVARVLYPGRPEHPDHAQAVRLLGGLFGSMLCFDLEGGREAVNAFLRRAPGIPFSPSLGDVTTTCSYPASTSHRYVPAELRTAQGITDGLIRLSVGIEPLDAIRRELARGLGQAD